MGLLWAPPCAVVSSSCPCNSSEFTQVDFHPRGHVRNNKTRIALRVDQGMDCAALIVFLLTAADRGSHDEDGWEECA
eukprot:14770767-Alexandrium_andersonii.AAC.1